MPTSERAIDEAIAELETKRQGLFALIEECDRAIEGMKAAKRLLCPGGTPASKPAILAVATPPAQILTPASNGGNKALPQVRILNQVIGAPPIPQSPAATAPNISTGTRRGERVVPGELQDGVHLFLQETRRVFTITELRDYLSGYADFSAEDLGDVLTSHLRRLVDDRQVVLVTRGVGRRVAEYAPAGVPVQAHLYGEKGVTNP